MLVVGFSVDYSAHIAHAFVHAEGTGEERATEALASIGRSVLCGGFSTWLAVALLPLSGSYFFRIVLFRSISFAVSKPLIADFMTQRSRWVLRLRAKPCWESGTAGSSPGGSPDTPWAGSMRCGHGLCHAGKAL